MTSYQDIYGVSLGEYCQAHGISVVDLIKKVETDIKLLKNRLRELVDKDEYVVNPLINEVYQTLKKKEKHLKRLKGWKLNEKN